MNELICPHCGAHLTTIETPPLSKWAGVELDLCLNDMCPYFLGSWKVLARQSGGIIGYRYFHGENGQEGPMAVGSVEAFKDCILTEEEKKYRKEREYRKEKEFWELCEAIEEAENKGDDQLSTWLRQLKKLKYPGK